MTTHAILTVILVVSNVCSLLSEASKTAAASKMEHFVIIVNSWKLLTIITKSSILDVAAVLDPLLVILAH